MSERAQLEGGQRLHGTLCTNLQYTNVFYVSTMKGSLTYSHLGLTSISYESLKALTPIWYHQSNHASTWDGSIKGQ